MLAPLGLDGWNLAVFVVVGFVAVMALARLMNRRRDTILEEMGRRIHQEKERRRTRKRRAEQRKLHEQLRQKRSQRAER